MRSWWSGGAVGVLTACVWSAGCVGSAKPIVEDRDDEPVPPNFVWIVADDWGPTVSDRLGPLAQTGVRFNSATPGRTKSSSALKLSVLLTGAEPDALGLDESGFAAVPPAGIKMLPELLRRAGYYTSRSGAPGHNLAPPPEAEENRLVPDVAEQDQPGVLGAWDAAGPAEDWRGREVDWEFPCTVAFGCNHAVSADRPFFALFRVEPHGDGLADRVENVLADLESDGVEDETFVFFIGVGGPSLDVRVRWPERFAGGTTRDAAVRLIDLAPTVLSLAGVPIPPHMAGQVLLAPLGSAGSEAMEVRADIVAPTPWVDGLPPIAAVPDGYPTGGLFHVAPRVDLSCATEGATIIYTTELEAPFRWRLYTGPFRMRFWTLRAKCGRLGYRDSEIVTYEFDIE